MGGRARNSARRCCCYCLRCSAPVLSRCHGDDHGPSLRIEGPSVFLGGITTDAAAQNWRGCAWHRHRTIGAPSFSPTVPGFLHHVAHSPFRPFAPSPIRPYTFVSAE